MGAWHPPTPEEEELLEVEASCISGLCADYPLVRPTVQRTGGADPVPPPRPPGSPGLMTLDQELLEVAGREEGDVSPAWQPPHRTKRRKSKGRRVEEGARQVGGGI